MHFLALLLSLLVSALFNVSKACQFSFDDCFDLKQPPSLCAGGQSTSNPLKVTPVTNPSDILHMLLAVSHAHQPDELLSANIAGFIWIAEVDLSQQTVRYLAPCAGDLPAPYLLAGNLKTFMG